jgi:hypothetical protein
MGNQMKHGRKYRDSGVHPKMERAPARVEALPAKSTFSLADASVWITLAVLAVFSFLTVLYPTVRALYHFEFNYNEGWNVYTTQTAMRHLPLYYPKYGWTTVNYPFLSFYVVGYLSHFMGDYLLTGRLVCLAALLASCVLVGLIIKELTGSWAPAVFGGVYCLGFFCAQTPAYVAMDDPQMLAHPFFLFGLWLYLAAPASTGRIAAITSVFILGGNIKQNLLSAPISVLSDLFLTSTRKAFRFLAFGILFLALSIVVNMLIGGRFFISHLLTSRSFSFQQLFGMFLRIYTPMGLPFAISIFWSILHFQNSRARVISFYFFSSLLIGAWFTGGEGVSQNAYFDNFFAMSIIMGACLDLLWKAPILSLGKGGRLRCLTPVILYSGVVLSFALWGFDLPKLFSALPEREKVFEAEVSFLASRPGPAICETLILCYDAGKPYVLDPFNSLRLMKLGKLNSKDLVEQIAERKYGAIQTEISVAEKPDVERFPDDVRTAIAHYYAEAVKAPACYIYIPRMEPQRAATPP